MYFVQRTCPNSWYGWVEASASQTPDLIQQMYSPALSRTGTTTPSQGRGHFALGLQGASTPAGTVPGTEEFPAMLRLGNTSGSEAGVPHSCRGGWAV